MQKSSIYLNLIHKQTIGKIKNKFLINYEVIYKKLPKNKGNLLT